MAPSLPAHYITELGSTLCGENKQTNDTIVAIKHTRQVKMLRNAVIYHLQMQLVKK